MMWTSHPLLSELRDAVRHESLVDLDSLRVDNVMTTTPTMNEQMNTAIDKTTESGNGKNFAVEVARVACDLWIHGGMIPGGEFDCLLEAKRAVLRMQVEQGVTSLNQDASGPATCCGDKTQAGKKSGSSCC